MPEYTTNLELFKYNPQTDGKNTFNITKALNENWDKLDIAIRSIGLPIGSIFQAIRTDIPENCLRLDGTEYSSGFENFVSNFLATGKIIAKSFTEWETAYNTNGGNVGFFAYDADTGKFKVPCIQSGTFLAQAVSSGEFGSFLNSLFQSHTHVWTGNTNVAGGHVHSLGNTTANDDGGVYITSGHTVDQGIVYTQYAGEHSHTVTGTNSYTGGNDTYPKHIKYPFFVVVSNVEAEQATQTDWDNFVGNLDTKLNFDLANISASGKSLVSSFASPSTTFIPWTLGAAGTTYVAPANGHMVIYLQTNANGGGLFLYNNTTQLAVGYGANNPNTGVGYCLRASRGDILAVDYSGYSSLLRFGFVYDKGEI